MEDTTFNLRISFKFSHFVEFSDVFKLKTNKRYVIIKYDAVSVENGYEYKTRSFLRSGIEKIKTY